MTERSKKMQPTNPTNPQVFPEDDKVDVNQR